MLTELLTYSLITGEAAKRMGLESDRQHYINDRQHYIEVKQYNWRGGRAVECVGLENRYTRKGTGGSNPPLSAVQL